MFRIDEAERLLGERVNQIMPVRGDIFVSTDTRIICIPAGSEVYNHLMGVHGRL